MVEHFLDVRCISKVFPVHKSLFGKGKRLVKAIDNVSFYIDKNETLALLGKTGSGKSTVGYSILRLIEPTTGEVFYNNADLIRYSQKEMRKERKNLQIIFQDASSSLNPVYSVESILKEVLNYYKLANNYNIDEKVDHLLSQVGLSPSDKIKYPKEFSTGQRQRICIARCLAVQPEFIVLDEITSALDMVNQMKIIDLLSEIKNNYKLSYLFITHNLDLAKYFSDRTAFIKDGKIIITGKTSEIEKDIRSYYFSE